MQLFYDSNPPAFYDAPTSFYDTAAVPTGTSKMKKAKTDTRGLAVPQKVARGREVITKLTANAALPALAPFIPELTTATNLMESDYQAALVARQTATQLTNQANASEAAWNRVFDKGCDLVNANTTTEAQRLSSGYPLTSDRAPVGPLGAPLNLAVTFGDLPGVLSATWDAVAGAKSYQVEIATAAGGPYTLVLSPTSSDCLIPNLTSGTTYYVRVKAVGTAGVSAPSDIAMKMAP